MKETQLSSFNNGWYKPGGNALKRLHWYFVSAAFFKSAFPVNGVKTFWLRFFGAEIGKNVVIKPHVNIKYPWRLKIKDNVWIGEQVWIDNLGDVLVEENVCVSQGAMLLCGNHDYKRSSFDLVVGNITLKKGSWVGAKAIVCPGVTVGNHTVLTVGSVASKDMEDYTIYRGNPAVAVKKREIDA